MEDLPSEVQLEVLVPKPADPQKTIGTQLHAVKGKGKSKRRKAAAAEPLEKYKIKSDIEVYFFV